MITLWNPKSKVFEAVDGYASPDQVLLNILIELRVHSFILSQMNQDVLKDELGSIRADAAVDAPDFVTGAIGPVTS